MRWLLRLLRAGIPSLVTACAPWPLGANLDARTSGLVGEWATLPAQGSPDTVVWLFRGDGTYETLHAAAGTDAGGRGFVVPITRGEWEVYRDAQGDPRLLVCFNHRATRWPSCRHFTVNAVSDTTGRAHRVLIWQGWVSQTKQTTALLTERRR